MTICPTNTIIIRVIVMQSVDFYKVSIYNIFISQLALKKGNYLH